MANGSKPEISGEEKIEKTVSSRPSRSERKKHKKSKWKNKNGRSIAEDDLNYLAVNTRYNEREIIEWHRNFRKDCPNGQLDKAKILTIYDTILPGGNSKDFVDQIFRIFDKDGNGSIDFKEFMLATDMTASGTPIEKLRWAFKMYDKDASGTIELSEMIEVIGTLYGMEGVEASEASTERAKRIFSELDINGDGELTCDEFVRGCMHDAELVNMLTNGGIHPMEADED